VMRPLYMAPSPPHRIAAARGLPAKPMFALENGNTVLCGGSRLSGRNVAAERWRVEAMLARSRVDWGLARLDHCGDVMQLCAPLTTIVRSGG
jgi:hypothetical protein